MALNRLAARVVAIVQARMSSSRLPAKVLADLEGRRAIDMVLDRLDRCNELDETIVATSGESSDDALVVALATRVPVVRGPLDDVLARYELAAREHPCDAVVRVTADCPLIDPEVVDLVVSRWRAGHAAYAANVIEPRTFPKGMDAEVMTVEALRAAAAEATDPFDREHVTPFIRSRPERFPQESVRLEPPAADLRLVLDTREDLTRLRAIVERHGHDVGMAALVEAMRG